MDAKLWVAAFAVGALLIVCAGLVMVVRRQAVGMRAYRRELETLRRLERTGLSNLAVAKAELLTSHDAFRKGERDLSAARAEARKALAAKDNAEDRYFSLLDRAYLRNGRTWVRADRVEQWDYAGLARWRSSQPTPTAGK